VTAALVGFAGVIVGAALAGVFEYAFRRRSEVGESRAASRLMLQELMALVWTTPETQHDQAERRPYDFSGPLETWRENRGTLARTLTNEEWETVSEAVGLVLSVHGAQPGRIGRPTPHAREVGMTDEMLEAGIIDLLVRRADAAVLALQRTAFGRGTAREVERERKELLAETDSESDAPG
jgi:hypothetical protein